MINTVAMQGLVASMANLNETQSRIANQISSGLRISSLSDDAVASGQAVAVAATLRTDAAFTAASSSVSSRMQASDAALSSVVTQMTSAIATSTAALNGTNNAADRAAAAQTLTALRNTVLSLANSSYDGSYLFGGGSSQQPFAPDASGNIVYNGSAATDSITAPGGTAIQTSLAGSDVFAATGANAFQALTDVIAALQTGNTSSSTNLLAGLRSSLDTVIAQRSLLNTSQSRLSNESDYVTQQVTNLKAQQSTLLSADTPTLATELSAVTAQRSALLSTIAAVQKGSLFDYL